MKEDNSAQDLIAFLKSNENKIYKFAYGYVKNQDIALDIVHEAIVKAIQQEEKIREKRYLKTWFYRILINECLGYLRKKDRVLFLEEIIELKNEEKSEEFSANNDNMDLYEAIDKLPEKLKTIIMLRFFEDMSLDEISQTIKVNLSTVKSRLYKALEILKMDMKGENL